MALVQRLVKGSPLTHAEADGNVVELGSRNSVYNSAFTYALNAITSYDGWLYRSLQNANLNHTPSSSPSWWSLIGTDYSSITNVPTARLLGRSTAGTGAIESISIGSGLSLAGGILSATGVGLTTEEVQDIVGAMFSSSTEITWSYDDLGNAISGELATASVAFSKLQNIATARLLGRSTAAAGVIEELTIGAGLSLVGGELSATGGGGGDPDYYAENATAPTIAPTVHAMAAGSVAIGENNHIGTSSLYSIIAGGTGNVIQNNGYASSLSAILGGNLNTITGCSHSVILAGEGNTLENSSGGSSNTAIGGLTCTSSGIDSIVFGTSLTQGESSWACALFGKEGTIDIGVSYALVSGKQGNAYLTGQRVLSGGAIATIGDSQASDLTVGVETTDDTSTDLRTSSVQMLGTKTDQTYIFYIKVAARQVGGVAGTVGDSAGFIFEGLMVNDAGALTIVGVPRTETWAMAGASAWTCTLTTAWDAISILVVGDVDKTIHWTAHIELCEVG